MKLRGDDDTLEGAHSFVALLEANLPHYGGLKKKNPDNPCGFSTVCPSLKCLQKLDNLYKLKKGQASQHS